MSKTDLDDNTSRMLCLADSCYTTLTLTQLSNPRRIRIRIHIRNRNRNATAAY